MFNSRWVRARVLREQEFDLTKADHGDGLLRRVNHLSNSALGICERPFPTEGAANPRKPGWPDSAFGRFHVEPPRGRYRSGSCPA
jgi:hypothetical protein